MKMHLPKLLFDELVIRQKLSTKCRSRRSVVVDEVSFDEVSRTGEKCYENGNNNDNSFILSLDNILSTPPVSQQDHHNCKFWSSNCLTKISQLYLYR